VGGIQSVPQHLERQSPCQEDTIYDIDLMCKIEAAAARDVKSLAVKLHLKRCPYRLCEVVNFAL
jgi:hypothetical protein